MSGTIDFFKDILGQSFITLSMYNEQAQRISLHDLDGFVVEAAARGLLVEVYIEDERPFYSQ